MKSTLIISALLVLPMTVCAEDLTGLPEPFAETVRVAQQTCSDFSNGEFAMEWGAVTRIDLDGDLYPDWVLDEASFACSTAASLYCGTGGCVSHFLIGETLGSFLNQGWTVITFGRSRVLLLDVHGSDCDGINPTPCFVARVWDEDATTWRSVKAGSVLESKN